MTADNPTVAPLDRLRDAAGITIHPAPEDGQPMKDASSSRCMPAATGMRIGYSMWGFLGAGVVDTPDGSRSYRRPFVDELLAAGHEVVFVQQNRDLREASLDLTDRYRWEPDGFPELDGVIFEWRWPLPGRNTTRCGTAGHTCDLHRQSDLLAHYTRVHRTRVLIWDFDRQLDPRAALRGIPGVAVGEFALAPTVGAHHLPCPVPDALLDAADPVELATCERPLPLVYVGNQYDRDDHFDQFFAPAAKRMPHRVAGKWSQTSRWPHVRFTGRAGFGEVEQIHASALATVLLLPERYWRVGHMTSRWWEALLAGCVPLLPADMVGAATFVPAELIVADGDDVTDRITWLRGIAGSRAHADLIAACLSYLEPFRCSTVAATALTLLEKPA